MDVGGYSGKVGKIGSRKCSRVKKKFSWGGDCDWRWDLPNEVLNF
jgi:hypothetical protein